MQGIVRTRALIFLLGLVLVPTIAMAVILFAKGYRPDFESGDLQPTGILVAQSYPDAAHIYLNNELKSATNTNLTLSPGPYAVEIKKDGFSTWRKSVSVEAGIVTRATAWLFPSVPSLKAITSTGASRPFLSPAGNRIAFTRQGQLFILDLSESPLGLLNRDAQPLVTPDYFNLSAAQLVWSPDSRQILGVATSSAILIDTNSTSVQDVTSQVKTIVQDWHDLLIDRVSQKNLTLPTQLQNIFATSAAQLVWSPKENKVLYVATSSALIPDNLIRQLPGSSTQSQTRQLTPGGVYVYDLEEDRNFLVGQTPLAVPTPTPSKKGQTPPLIGNVKLEIGYHNPAGLSWFPTSNHLISVSDGKVIITEYDSQNPTIVYEGPMFENFAAPYPSGTQLVILSNLNPTSSTSPNLYAVTLR